jgi:hypothetical protein
MLPLQHRSSRLAGVLAAAVATGALAASPALAGPAVGPDGGNGASTEPAPAPAPVIVRSADEGFDVGSAAIGAGGAGALLIVVSLGGLAVASRHRVATVRGPQV